jgi:hypothetical protein
MRRVAILATILLLGSFTSSSASAAPCSGFSDVDGGSPLCPAVDWLKNRSITLGCGVGVFCPNDFVTRLQMATFLYRMGAAVEPDFLHEAQIGNLASTVNNEGVVCSTSEYVVAYPRVASSAGAMLYHGSAVATDVGARLVYRLPPNTLWFDWGSVLSRSVSAPGQYVSQSPTAGPLPLNVGTTIVFGISTIGGSGPPQTSWAACELTVRLDSRNGAFAPF